MHSHPPPRAAPTGLAAASVSHDSVTLGWDDPDDGSITGYLVLRRDIVNQAPGTFSTVEPNTGSAATTYVDTTVAAETRYAYRVKAINASGTSEQSNYVNVETPAAPTPSVPEQPTGLAAKSVSHDSVTLSWDDPGDDTVTGYQVLRRSRDGGEYGDGQGAREFVAVVDDTGTSATTYTDTSVAAHTRYVYRVKAINSEGMSERSTYLNVETPEPPDKPEKTEEQQGDQQPRQSQNVTIPDSGLRRAIQAALGRSEGSTTPITTTNLAGLTTLDASRRGIDNITGLEHATNLTTLNLRMNDLSGGSVDFSPFTSLQTLDLTGNDLTSIDLTSNTSLTKLDLSGNDLTGITGLSSLTALTHLVLRDNCVTSIDLSSNTALTHLYIGQMYHPSLGVSCALSSIDLSSNTALTHLDLSNSGLTSIDLEENTALTYLDISGNLFVDDEDIDLDHNTALTELYAQDNNRLEEIDLRNNTALTKLVYSDSRRVAIPQFRCNVIGLAGLTNLTHLSMRNCNLNSIPSLSSLTALTHIDFGLNQGLINEPDLSDNTNLVHANFYACSLDSIDVDGLSKLMYLNVWKCTATPRHVAQWQYLHVDDIENIGDLPSGAVVEWCATLPRGNNESSNNCDHRTHTRP